MKKKINIQKDILYLSISSFVLVVAWIGFNLYHTWATSTITTDVQKQLRPIAPQFDAATIDLLKNRQRIVPVFELKNAPVTAPNPTALVTPKTDRGIQKPDLPAPTDIVPTVSQPAHTVSLQGL